MNRENKEAITCPFGPEIKVRATQVGLDLMPKTTICHPNNQPACTMLLSKISELTKQVPETNEELLQPINQIIENCSKRAR